MRTYEPRQTRYWSTRELNALIGKRISVQVNGSESAGAVEYDGVACD